MERVGGPLKDLLARLRLSRRMEGWRAVELWPRVVGERVASHARAAAFRDGVLVVEVESTAWMNELAYLRTRIARDLNRELGSETVREIRLQPAAAGPDRRRTENEGR